MNLASHYEFTSAVVWAVPGRGHTAPRRSSCPGHKMPGKCSLKLSQVPVPGRCPFRSVSRQPGLPAAQPAPLRGAGHGTVPRGVGCGVRGAGHGARNSPAGCMVRGAGHGTALRGAECRVRGTQQPRGVRGAGYGTVPRGAGCGARSSPSRRPRPGRCRAVSRQPDPAPTLAPSPDWPPRPVTRRSQRGPLVGAGDARQGGARG